MEALDLVHLALDIALAATLSAWLVAFATDAGADRATRAMAFASERVRVGALAIAMGLLVDVATLVFALTDAGDIGAFLGLLAYPLLIGGAVALASATWTAPKETA